MLLVTLSYSVAWLEAFTVVVSKSVLISFSCGLGRKPSAIIYIKDNIGAIVELTKCLRIVANSSEVLNVLY